MHSANLSDELCSIKLFLQKSMKQVINYENNFTFLTNILDISELICKISCHFYLVHYYTNDYSTFIQNAILRNFICIRKVTKRPCAMNIKANYVYKIQLGM